MPTVRTGDVETYYERRGEGPPIVFVHASILDHSMWDEQAAALADNYETLVYDLRGHGRTAGSAVPAYSIDLFAEDLDALLDTLAVGRPVLCGLSMGGLVAQTYAAKYPDRVAGLILADTFTPRILTRGEWFLRRIVLNALIPPVRLVGYERVEKANVWLTERLFAGAGGDYENVERLRETGPKMATDEFAKVILAMTRFHEESVDLSAIAVPTLVLYGERELPFVKRHAAELAARLSDVEVDEVPDAGHASNLDASDYFTAAVRSFLERVHGGGGPAG
ncbi:MULTISPECIES: alpha/beta fold hydrolase [Halorussus]|uniref:alpha/beta fold hydrolase n=1 Tax=Halorussus TaxID=1070314 RepID=UPI0020A0BB11|nr:alpha/beta fold hydrolase [Halorussus vallis]USZ76648.1 alpha/beta fold hydrolase [Halorussus vallis]